MEYKRLGQPSLQVSELSFCSWITFGNQTGDNTSEKLIDMAYEAGVNFFDNAEQERIESIQHNKLTHPQF